MKKVLACILMVVFVFTLCSCRSSKTVFVNLSENIEPIEIKRQNLSDDFISAQQNFALKLFATEYKKERQNINISPYSLSFALGIVASGAQGDTLSQFETFLMNGMNREEWNKNMFSYLKKNKNRFSQADSLWIAHNKSNVKETFLQNAKGYFGANVYSLNFKNKEAVREVNNWVKENTQGKIQEIADDIDSNTTMYVANTLYIDFLWATTHRASDVKEEFFTCANGEKSRVKMMYSTLDANQQTYICDKNAEGFIKKCQGDYKFIAIMPNEDVNMVDYINSFDATYLNSIMSNSQNIKLKTAMPQFVIENSVDFRETLIKLKFRSSNIFI
jgi:serpin B